MNKNFYRRIFTVLFWLAIVSPSLAVEFNVPRLSPLPINLPEQRISLNGEWRFTTAFKEGKNELGNFESTIKVPGEWVMQGFNVKKETWAGYGRTFELPATWKGKRVKLRCNAVYSRCILYVNGEKAGSHLGGFTPFEIDVTDKVKIDGVNELAVSVMSESLADKASSASEYAVHPLGGIPRDIYLFALPEVNLSLFHASTTFDSDYKNAVLKVEADVTNECRSNMNGLGLEFTLQDKEGNKVPLSISTNKLKKLKSGETQHIELSLNVTEPKKWDCEHPYLYTLICRLKKGRKVLEETSRRIGFRQIEVRGNQVFVNNHPIKLRGVCRHEVMPLRGRSLCDDMWRKDVELFRRGNVNYIRTSHYPPDEALLNACDELGMFVEVEAPFCWAHKTQIAEDDFYEVLVNQHVEMVNRDRSHPSILMWSIGNESKKFNEYFRCASEVVRKMDPTRPRIFSQWAPKGDEGALEIANHHYPGPKGPQNYKNHPRPVVFDEYCHVNAYNRFELAADPGLRNAWGALLDKMWTDMYKSQGVLGGAIWVGIDDTFFLPDGRTVGYGTWGVVDGWRREKPEYWNMKKAYSPIRLVLPEGCKKDTRLILEVENRYLFSNLSECELNWKAGNKSGTVTADIPPRSKDTVMINIGESMKELKELELSVIGVQGFEVDKYCFNLSQEENRPFPVTLQKSDKLNYEETPDVFQVTIGDIQVAVNKIDGMFSVTDKKGCLLNDAPLLMLLPLNKEGDGVQMTGKSQIFAPYNPVCTEWTKDSVDFIIDESKIAVKVIGRYKEAAGCFTYTIYSDGKLTVDYDFTLLEAVSPRQTGLVFTLPSDFTHLEWKRKGYWNVYPDGHIGGIQGEADAFNKRLPISGLAGPCIQPLNTWETDQTANGSNGFRSTKENFYQAVLWGDNNRKVKIVSDGNGHFRSWVTGDKVYFLVADYSNGGSEKFLKPAKVKHRKMEKGDNVTGQVEIAL